MHSRDPTSPPPATASSRAGELFLKRGVTTLANDAMVSAGLFMLGVLATLVAVDVMLLVESLLAYLFPNETVVWMVLFGPCMIGLYVYVTVVFTVLHVVHTSFKAVFVCFVQVCFLLAFNYACSRSVGGWTGREPAACLLRRTLTQQSIFSIQLLFFTFIEYCDRY